MNKCLLALILISIFNVSAAKNVLEIPVHQMVKMNFNDADSSSKPEVMWRQFEYTSSATPEELLKFYRASKHVKSCDYNDMADNYMCKLAKHNEVSSGYVFIPSQSKNGEVVILADYFFIK